MSNQTFQLQAELLGKAFERYAELMAEIAAQSALDMLDFVCDEATREAVKEGVLKEAAEAVIGQLLMVRMRAIQAYQAARKHWNVRF